ncbi:hypothetical protein H4R19_001565, partial [Coemansia spiralis]
MDSSDFEATPEPLARPRTAIKRKRRPSLGHSAITYTGSGELATDSDQSGAGDPRWDIKRVAAGQSRGAGSSGSSRRGASGPAANLPPRMRFHTAPEDEEVEHAELEVLNESPPDDGEAELTDDLPCRVLDNFVVFDLDRGNAVAALDDVGLEGTDITIAGCVEPLRSSSADGSDVAQGALDDEDEDEDDGDGGRDTSDEGSRAASRAGCSGASRSTSVECAGSGGGGGFAQRIRLSAILNYETYVAPSGETEIWVRTCFAWYKLRNPHPGYMHIYSPLFKRVYMAHQAIARATSGSSMTIAQFIRDLRESPSDIISRMPPITEGEFRKFREDIVEEIEICLEAAGQLELMDAPLIRAICGLGDRGGRAARPRTGATSLARGTRTTGKTAAVGEPKHENPACVTPLIASIAQGLYARHLMNVSAYEATTAAATTAATSTPGDGAAAKGRADAWKKRYTEGSKAKQSSAENAQGIVSLADLQQHASVTRLRPSSIRSLPGSRLPQIEDDRIYHSEILVSGDANCSDGADGDGSDDTTIRVGGTVLVRALHPATGYDAGSLWDASNKGQADGAATAAAGDGTLVRAIQVVSIMYAVHEQRWMVHGRLLLPGRDTVLQEVALPNEWYLVDSCRTYWLRDTLCGTVDMAFVSSAQEIDAAEWASEGRLFCRFWHDPSTGMYEDVNRHIQGTGDVMPMWCRACKLKQTKTDPRLGRIIVGVQRAPMAEASAMPIPVGRIIPEFRATAKIGNVEYHVNDTVYVLSEHSDQPFQIGYILRFVGGGAGLQVELQMLKRVRILPPDKRPGGVDASYDDERHLYWTPLVQEHDAASLRGKCWVTHPDEVDGPLNAYKDADPDAFYAQYESVRIWPDRADDWIRLRPAQRQGLSHAADDGDGEDGERIPEPPRCAVCRNERGRRAHQMAQFLGPPGSAGGEPEDGGGARGQRPLRALDLFSGCGGLTQGMDQSGVVRTLWAVEYMPSAGFTFAQNHPEAQVYNQCSNLLLESAIKAHHGVAAEPLVNKFDGKQLPPMPQPGD